MPRLPALLTTYRNTFVSRREARLSHAPLFGHQCEDRQPPGLFRSIGFLRRGSLVTRCARTRLRHAVRILGGASTAGTRGGHGDPRALREQAITLRSPYGKVRYDRFWPDSAVTSIRRARKLSGDKLPSAAIPHDGRRW